MEVFCIVVVKWFYLFGFGDWVIIDLQGNIFLLNWVEDFYLCVVVNIVFMGKMLVVLVNQEDILFIGVSCILLVIQYMFKVDEVGCVVFIYLCGGWFVFEDSGYME